MASPARFSNSLAWIAACLALWLCSSTKLCAQNYLPGVSYFGRSNYIEYIAGELPVIFSAPHGGSLQPAEIPNRTYGTFATDANTEDLARRIRTEFGNRFGLLPHVIICRLDRDKIDCNREIVEGAQGDPEAQMAWNEFHDFIGSSVTNVTQRHQRGFYIDLHGHVHDIQRLELGYLLSDSELNSSDATLNGAISYQNSSSVRTLSAESPLTFSALLRGSNSFGGLIGDEGYPSVPSPGAPGPGADPYFTGGYNTDRYGSVAGGPIDALQIESNYMGVRSNATQRTAFAQALARTVERFYFLHHGVNLRESLPKAWVVGSGSFGTAGNWLNGCLPVSTNHLLLAGAGGALNHNLPALATGAGYVGSLTFSNAPTGSYTLSGNPFSVLRGITNNSGLTQTINNHLTLGGPQSFAANTGALVLGGNVTNGGHQLQITGAVTANGIVTGSGAVVVTSAGALRGAGTISSPVHCTGAISPGQGVGKLTLGGGLNLDSGGTCEWELAAPTTAGEGVNYDQLILTGGNLVLGGESKLQLNFLNAAATPNVGDPFWLTSHSWKIISLAAGATNATAGALTSVLNGSFAVGSFTNRADAAGNVWLIYTAVPAMSPIIQAASRNQFGEFVLTVGAETNRTYVLQSSISLESPVWENLGTNIVPNSLLTLTSVAASPVRFFRVMVLP